MCCNTRSFSQRLRTAAVRVQTRGPIPPTAWSPGSPRHETGEAQVLAGLHRPLVLGMAMA